MVTTIYFLPLSSLANITSSIFPVLILTYFWTSGRRCFATNAKPLFGEKVLNQFYMRISVVIILWIKFFADFILSLINVYSMWCALSSIF